MMKTNLLTDKEKECLRLLLFPMRPKEIAVALDRSVHTVNGHLQEARRKLGATDSLSAAHMLRGEEHPQIFEGVNLSGSPAILQSGHVEAANASCETEGRTESWDTPFARKGRPWNDLTLRWRIAWPVLLFFLVALGVSALTNGAASLSALYLSFSR